MEKNLDIIEVDQWVSREKFCLKVFFADLEKTTSEVYIDSIMINIGNYYILFIYLLNLFIKYSNIYNQWFLFE